MKYEPTFVLRAQDKFAPSIIERWAAEVERENGCRIGPEADKTKQKIREARALAHQMRAWQELNRSKIPD